MSWHLDPDPEPDLETQRDHAQGDLESRTTVVLSSSTTHEGDTHE